MKEIVAAVYSLLSLAVIMATMPLYRQPLVDYSVNTLIPEMQGTTSGHPDQIDSFKVDAIHIYSNTMLNLVHLAPVVFFMLKTDQRSRAFYYCFLDMCFEITNNCLKLAYHDPRPYWISSDVLSFSCSKHYGNPSGHSMWTMGISLAVVMDISRSNPHSKLFAWLSCFIALFIGISVGASRLYLGAHSLDQVIYGWLLGIWLAATAEYTYKKSLMNHIQTLNTNRLEDLRPLSFLLVASTIVMAVVLACEISIYLIINPNIVNKTVWKQNIARDCGADAVADSFQEASYPVFGIVALGYGAYLGTLAQTKFFEGRIHFIGPKQSISLKVLARLVIFIMIIAVTFLPLYYIASRFWGGEDNLNMLLMFQIFLPLLLMTFCTVGLADRLFHVLHLYDEYEYSCCQVLTSQGNEQNKRQGQGSPTVAELRRLLRQDYSVEVDENRKLATSESKESIQQE